MSASVPVVVAHENLTRVDTPTVVDDQIAQLQKELITERNGRLEERFYLASLVGLLLMLLAFASIGLTAGILTAVMYVAFLIVFSKRCGVEGVQEALITSGQFIKGLVGKGDDKEKKDEDEDK